MIILDLAAPNWGLAAGFALVAAAFVVVLRRYLRGRDVWRYDTRAAWLRAGAYFSTAWAIASATGTLPTILAQPVVRDGQLADPVWLVGVVVVTLVVVIGYWVIWPIGTRAHGRRVVIPDTLLFGLAWGVSEGLLFASVYVTSLRLLGGLWGGRVWAAVLTIVVISLFNGVGHATYWDVHVSPEHNVIDWNLRKVALVHTPNLMLTTVFVAWHGNLGLWVGWETIALVGSAVMMRFPTFRRPHPPDPTRPQLGSPAPLPSRMDGRTVVLTGAAGGIGSEVARRLAAVGAHLVLVDVDEVGVRQVADELLAAGGTAEVVVADLSTTAGVRALAEQLEQRCELIDVLINNAGIFTSRFRTNADGVELTLAVNHVAPVLLTELLLDRLEASRARVIFVSSDAHWQADEVDWDDVNGRALWGDAAADAGTADPNAGFAAYNRSKLLLTAAALDLAGRLEESDVTVNVLTPGALVASTGMYDEVTGPFAWFVRVMRPLLRDTDKAALGYLYLATSPEVDGVSGWYFKDLRPIEASLVAQDPEFRARVREWTVDVGAPTGQSVVAD